jgi:cobalamin biosynthesis protein CobT
MPADETSLDCDICGQTTKPEGYCDQEYAKLTAIWGYDSKHDGEMHSCTMCEECYQRVREFIEEQLKGKVNVVSSF